MMLHASARVFVSSSVHTVTEKCDSRRISPLSRRFMRQSHFSATVWTGLKPTEMCGTSGILRTTIIYNCDRKSLYEITLNQMFRSACPVALTVILINTTSI